MNRLIAALAMAGSLSCGSLYSQNRAPDPVDTQTTIRVNSRAVLVDVIVTDQHGKPVTGLKQDSFAVTEQGKPQAIDFFEEHHANQPTEAAAPMEIPKLPPDVFSNFSPFPPPPAVNVLLLDSLNTRMESQSFVHQQAMKFLNSAKPGSRMAIFTMGLGLHFIQGFNDDPAVLAAALKDKKNNHVEASVMLKGADESNAQQNLIGMMSASVPSGGGTTATTASPDAIASLINFMNENDTAQSFDRMYVTLANLQKLAAFLEGFPGRKNIIWFAEKVPALFVPGTGGSGGPESGNPGMESELKKTLAMLAAARAAIYPVDARGVTVSGGGLYTAEKNLSHGITSAGQLLGPTSVGSSAGAPNGAGGGFANAQSSDSIARNGDQADAQILADESGGKAFANTNGLSHVMADIAATSGDFYTVSYAPTNAKMDGAYRDIKIKVAGDYHLSYRRGYFAVDEALPGSSLVSRDEAIRKLAVEHPGEVDPLLPFMDLGMPQSEQILYTAKVQPIPAKDGEPESGKNKNHYSIDFAVDLKDLNLRLDSDGLHKGNLNVSLIAYDRYGNIVSRKDHLIALNIKPDVYAVFENTGVQLHAEIAVPKGNFWLRTGVYDRNSRKVGTMEIPLSSVKPLETAAAQ
jgi:VWFA-related protein